MSWSKTLPVIPGYYWFRYIKRDGTPHPAEVCELVEVGRWWFIGNQSAESLEGKTFEVWPIPLDPPA